MRRKNKYSKSEISKDFIKSEYLRVKKELGRVPLNYELVSRVKFSAPTIIVRFGSYYNLLKIFGDEDCAKNHRKTRQELEKKYSNLKGKLGRVPTIHEMGYRDTYVKHFGRWRDFVKSMNDMPLFETNRKNKKNESLLLLKKFCNELKRRPSCREIDKCPYTPTSGLYKYCFGSVTEALKIIAPEYSKELPSKKYNNDNLIEEFYRVKKLIKRCPNYEKMKKYAKYHPCIIQSRFGSWSNFLKMLDEKVQWNSWSFKGKKRRFISKDGHVHLSKNESEIDDILYELKIPHEVEVLYPFDKEYNKNCRKRCDFFIDNTYVEYAGMLYYHNLAVRRRYRKLLDEKTNMCLENGWDFMVFTPDSKKNMFNDIKGEFGGK